MSLETNTIKTNLEAGSFKALKNVADVARQVMIGEDQEKLEIQELVNIISATSYLDETQKTAIHEILGFSKAEKEKAAANDAKMKADADKRRADKAKEKEQKEREFDAKMAKARQSR